MKLDIEPVMTIEEMRYKMQEVVNITDQLREACCESEAVGLVQYQHFTGTLQHLREFHRHLNEICDKSSAMQEQEAKDAAKAAYNSPELVFNPFESHSPSFKIYVNELLDLASEDINNG